MNTRLNGQDCTVLGCSVEERYTGTFTRERLLELLGQAVQAYVAFSEHGGTLGWPEFYSRYLIVRLNADTRLEAVKTAEALSKVFAPVVEQQDDGDLGTASGRHTC
jgi:hypothetical protein